MTAAQTTLHLPLMDAPAGAEPTGAHITHWAQTQPPAACLRAPTPGVGPEWGPDNANPEDVNNLDRVPSMIGW